MIEQLACGDPPEARGDVFQVFRDGGGWVDYSRCAEGDGEGRGQDLRKDGDRHRRVDGQQLARFGVRAKGVEVLERTLVVESGDEPRGADASEARLVRNAYSPAFSESSG